MSPAGPAPAVGDETLLAGNPEFAWKELLLVIDFLKQAEIKAAGSIAAAGVLGGILYNFVKSQAHPGVLLAVLVVTAAALICVTAVFGALVFWPRLRHREEPESPLFFHHIARRHSEPAPYVRELAVLSSRAEDLFAAIAEQIFENSRVARRKYTWASRAVGTLMLAVICMGLVAGVLGLRSLT